MTVACLQMQLRARKKGEQGAGVVPQRTGQVRHTGQRVGSTLSTAVLPQAAQVSDSLLLGMFCLHTCPFIAALSGPSCFCTLTSLDLAAAALCSRCSGARTLE